MTTAITGMPKTARCKGFDEPVQVPMTKAAMPAKSKLVALMVGDPSDIPAPHYPGSDEFQIELDEVIECRSLTARGEWPADIYAKDNPANTGDYNGNYGRDVPELLKHMEIHDSIDAAMVVQMDKRMDLGLEIFTALTDRGATPARPTGYIDFVEGGAAFDVRLATRIYGALRKTFAAKWYYGLERPETVLGLPAEVFCQDDMGAPGHFAYPAGHATVAGVVAKLAHEEFQISGTELSKMVHDACWQFGMWRMGLGVHYRQDCVAGYDVGWNFG